MAFFTSSSLPAKKLFFSQPIPFKPKIMSNRMLVLVGLPGSGKSTISNHFVQCKKVERHFLLFILLV